MNRNIKISLRRLKQDKVNNIIKLSGFVMGLTIASIVLIYTVNESGYDKFHANGDRIYQVVDSANVYGVIWATAPFIVGEALQNEFPEVEAYAHHYNIPEFKIKKGATAFNEENILCTESSFFDIFSFKIVQGSAKPLDENPNAIILTESKARKYFGDQNPVGEILQLEINDSLFLMNVCGVMRDFPKNSSLKANFVASIDLSFPHIQSTMFSSSGTNPTTEEIKTGWDYSVFFGNYLLLKDKADAAAFNIKLTAFTEKNGIDPNLSHMSMVPFTEIYFNHQDLSTNYVAEYGNLQMILILSFVGLIILIVSIINYFNISIAQLFVKKRSIAIYNVCGATRKNIAWQFITESVILALITLPLVLLLVYLCLPAASALLGKEYELKLFDYPLSIVLIFAVTIAVGIFSGLLISIKASSQKTINALKNIRDRKQKLMPSKVMLTFQISVFIALVVTVFAVYKQVHYSMNKNLGFDKENLLIVNFDENSEYNIFRETIKSNPDILSVSGSMWLPPTTNNMVVSIPKKDEPDVNVSLRGLMVDNNFARTMGMELVAGRGFTENDTRGVLLNQIAVKKLGFTDPIGEQVAFGQVTGVIKDFHYASIHEEMPPVIILLNPGQVYEMVIRTAPGKTPEVIDYLKKEWPNLNTETPFEFEFFDKKVQKLYESDMRMAKIVTGFALLSIVIAVLGLVGLSIFTSRQRIKEIGIRKVNGAKVSEILSMLNKEYIKWVVIAFVIASPVAWYAMHKWLENFAYKTTLSWWIFALGGILAMGIALLTVSWQSWKAATRNPVDALRYE